MRSEQKRLEFWVMITVIITIISSMLNFSILLSGRQASFFNVCASLAFLIVWAVLVVSSRRSFIALALCASYWLVVLIDIIATIAMHDFGFFLMIKLIFSTITVSPLIGLQINFLGITQPVMILCISLAFLALIAIVAIWQWRSNRRNGAK